MPDPTKDYGWSDIRPKVTASGLAYGGCLALWLVLGDLGIDLEADTQTSVTGFIMLLTAYLWPNK